MENASKTFTVTIPEELVEKMDAECAKYGGSRVALIRRVFTERYEEQERQERETKQAQKSKKAA